MIATLDERHIARGYDPYNSADQPWLMRLVGEKNSQTDEQMRRDFQALARYGYEFFPGTIRSKETYKILEPTEAERRKYF